MAKLRIGVTGSSGFLGRGLMQLPGDTWVPLARTGKAPRWNPEAPEIEAGPMHAVIHLAGEPVAQRWSDRAKKRILDSRMTGTHNLAAALASMDQPPQTLVSGSAVGFYGNTGMDQASEGDPVGGGFLAEVVAQWEAAADPARDAGIRVVHPRVGIVLGNGGALEKLLPPFKMGVGGPIGNGKQGFPWIAYDDTIGALRFLAESKLEGPVNVVAPFQVSNAEFAKHLGKAMHRPSFMPLPGFAVKTMFGQMGKEVLLWGQRLRPNVLENAGYSFQYPELDGALKHLLGSASNK